MVISLTKATALTKEISFSVGGKVKPRDLSVFCRQFTSMVNAGVTILDTLDMLSDQTENKVMAKAIRGVHAEIQKVRLSRMVSKNTRMFSLISW